MIDTVGGDGKDREKSFLSADSILISQLYAIRRNKSRSHPLNWVLQLEVTRSLAVRYPQSSGEELLPNVTIL